jgi:hypothetical protein
LVLGGSGLIIPMIIQTIQLVPPRPNGKDDAAHVSRVDPTAANQSDADQPPTDLAVGGSSPSRRAPDQQVCRFSEVVSRLCRVALEEQSLEQPEEESLQHGATVDPSVTVPPTIAG